VVGSKKRRGVGKEQVRMVTRTLRGNDNTRGNECQIQNVKKRPINLGWGSGGGGIEPSGENKGKGQKNGNEVGAFSGTGKAKKGNQGMETKSVGEHIGKTTGRHGHPIIKKKRVKSDGASRVNREQEAAMKITWARAGAEAFWGPQ